MSRLALFCTLFALGVVSAQDAKVRGRVLDDEGAPIADVAVCTFVAGERFVTAELVTRASAISDADGAFVLEEWPAGDARAWDRVLLVAPGRLHTEATRDEVARFPVVLTRGVVLAGSVRDADGRPVTGVRVEAGDALADARYLGAAPPNRGPQARTAVRTDARGAFALVGACASAATVAVSDAGWRPVSLAPVAMTEPLELVSEAAPAIRGVVVDGDGVPATGAILRATSGRLSEAVRTGVDGVFTLTASPEPVRLSVKAQRADQHLFARETIPPGATELRIVLQGLPPASHAPKRALRPVAPARSVRVSAVDSMGRAPDGSELSITLDPLRTVQGTLQMRPPPLAVAVRLAPHQPGVWSSTEEADLSSSFPLDRTGRFTIPFWATGKFEAQLIVLRRGRQGPPDKIPLGVVEVGVDTDELRLVGESARPAQVRGRIEGNVPPQRLAVLSAPGPSGKVFSGCAHYQGPICAVAPDGSFELQEPPGSRLLAVIDVWTGALLARTELVEVEPGSRREVILRADAVCVAFRVGGEGFDEAERFRVEILPEAEQWPAGVGQIRWPENPRPTWVTGLGARLSPGQTTGTLYLPNAPCELRLRTGADLVLCQQRIDPQTKAGRDVRFVIAK